MLVNRLKGALIAAAAAGVLVVGLGTGPAGAAVIPFIWAPSAVAGSTAVNATGSSFTINDLATINIPSQVGVVPGVTEHAVLVESSINGIDTGLIDWKGDGTTTANYQLWFDVTSIETLTFAADGSASGVFTALTYKMFEDVGGNCQFSNPGNPTVSGGSCTPVQLAHGALSGPQNEIHQTSAGTPSATVDTSIVADFAGFFVLPPPADFIHLILDVSFINNPGIVTTNCGAGTFPGACTILLGAPIAGFTSPGGGKREFYWCCRCS